MKQKQLDALNRVHIDLYKNIEKQPIVIVLDNIRSLNNVGAFFRTSDAFSIQALYLCGITGQPPHKDIHKTALGATESVDWFYFKDTMDILLDLKKQGYLLCAIEQTDCSINLLDFKPDLRKKIAFIFGNEVDGISEKVLSVVNLALEIPQFGTKHSFNVAVSAGIILWDYFSKTHSH